MTPDDLDPAWRERYEERAAIMQEGCKCTYEQANERAWVDIQRQIERARKAWAEWDKRRAGKP